jgi:pilus assembly protein CpaF
MRIIEKIVSRVGRRIDESSPMVDARLPDGSRVNAVIPPVAVDGPLLSIRRFRRDRITAAELVRNLTLTEGMLELLEACVKARLNMIISGGTGAGKTTLLNVLSDSFPKTSASSPSRTQPSCNCGSRTWRAWRRGRPTSRVRARSASGSS